MTQRPKKPRTIRTNLRSLQINKPPKPKPKIKTVAGNVASDRDPIKMFVHRSDTVFVVGGGPSLKAFNFKLLEGHDTIASNGAVFDVPNPKYFVTMDFTFLRKMRSAVPILNNYPYLTKCFIASMGGSLVEEGGKFIDKKFNLTYDLSAFDTIIKSYRAEEMGFTFKDFRNGGNSGFCALQLAIVLGYKNIFLLGMDLTIDRGNTHYHGHYHGNRKFPQKLNTYLMRFKSGIECAKLYRPDLNIISCSSISKLNQYIKYISIDEVLK